MSENTAGGTVETPKEVDWEARAKKAEAKIVDMKTNTTPETTPEVKEVKVEEPKTTDTPNFMTKQDYESERFFEANPGLKEHKETINEYVSKGLTFDEAEVLLKKKDPTIENRQKTKQSNFTAGDTPVNKESYTMEQLEDPSLSQEEYNRIMAGVESGKVKITN